MIASGSEAPLMLGSMIMIQNAEAAPVVTIAASMWDVRSLPVVRPRTRPSAPIASAR